jgi:transcription antitermination factor NusG
MEVLNAPGVSRIVGWSGRPAVIPNEQIDSIRNLLESSLPIEPHDYLRCGERVRIHEGALRGTQGILVRRKKSFRLVVSVELLGRSVSIEVDLKSVEPIDGTQSIATIPYSLDRPISSMMD